MEDLQLHPDVDALLRTALTIVRDLDDRALQAIEREPSEDAAFLDRQDERRLNATLAALHADLRAPLWSELIAHLREKAALLEQEGRRTEVRHHLLLIEEMKDYRDRTFPDIA